MKRAVGVVLIALVGAACAVALFVDVRNRELSAIKEIFETASSDRTKALSVRAMSVVKSGPTSVTVTVPVLLNKVSADQTHGLPLVKQVQTTLRGYLRLRL